LNSFYIIGQQNDARMNVVLALTAAQNGATIANHCEVVELIKNEEGHVKGAKMKDCLTGYEWEVKAKVTF
jgi:glycerol-3-phosphate dehydrogenase